MVKKMITLIPALCLIFSIAGCGQNKSDTVADTISLENSSGTVADRITKESDGSQMDLVNMDNKKNNSDPLPAESEFTSMIMVNGTLYYDTGRESTLTGRCGTFDGEITSSVDGSETPEENDQSNFGSGYGYQYGENGTIEVNRNDKWTVFEEKWVEYTYDDSEHNVKFSFKYPEGWKLTEERPYDGDENQEGNTKSTGVSFQFLNPDSDYDTDQFLIIASLEFPFEVDESLFASEPFETAAGLAATKYTRELDGRVYVYYIFGDGVTVPQYTSIAAMSIENYEILKNDIEAVTKTLEIMTD